MSIMLCPQCEDTMIDSDDVRYCDNCEDNPETVIAGVDFSADLTNLKNL